MVLSPSVILCMVESCHVASCCFYQHGISEVWFTKLVDPVDPAILKSSMPSKGNKHPADFPYSWMVLYAFFSFTVCFGHSLTGVMVRLASDGVGTARSPSAYVTFATWLILK